jgi:hypothetical protein
MRTSHLRTAALLAAAVAAAALIARGSNARADGQGTVTLAVYGDSPYGAVNGDTTQLAKTPAFIASINGDPDVSRVLHVGDIHSGSDHCYLPYDQTILRVWAGTDSVYAGAGFADPLVYTPGDNEWTDCNKSKEGGGAGGDAYYDTSQPGHLPGDPLDNLAVVRSLFFPVAGQTLGANPAQVTSQAVAGPKKYRSFVENVRWEQNGVMFVTVNLPGSNNDTLPWFGLPTSQRQLDERNLRTAADLAWLNDAYNLAEAHGDAGLLIGTQADMWDPAAAVPGGDGLDQYNSVVNRIAKLTRDFGRPVLLINGDSHVYESDNPMSSSDPLYPIHPLGFDVPNFSRLTVHGKTEPMEWVKLTVDPASPQVFSWSRVTLP